MLWRIAAVVVGLGTSAVRVGNIRVARNYLGRIENAGDLLVTALPIGFAVVALLASLGVCFLKPARNAIRGAVQGAFVATSTVTALLAWQLWNNSDLLANDGTAYWALLSIPCFWFGIPFVLISVGAGVAIQRIRRPTVPAH